MYGGRDEPRSARPRRVLVGARPSVTRAEAPDALIRLLNRRPIYEPLPDHCSAPSQRFVDTGLTTGPWGAGVASGKPDFPSGGGW